MMALIGRGIRAAIERDDDAEMGGSVQNPEDYQFCSWLVFMCVYGGWDVDTILYINEKYVSWK